MPEWTQAATRMGVLRRLEGTTPLSAIASSRPESAPRIALYPCEESGHGTRCLEDLCRNLNAGDGRRTDLEFREVAPQDFLRLRIVDGAPGHEQRLVPDTKWPRHRDEEAFLSGTDVEAIAVAHESDGTALPAEGCAARRPIGAVHESQTSPAA